MAAQSVAPSKRALASRQNGRLGGLATAKTHTAEYLEERSSRAGQANRDRYGTDFYRFIVHRRKTRKRQPTQSVLTRTTKPESKAAEKMQLMLNSVLKLRMA